MTSLNLNHLTRIELQSYLLKHADIVACLCAAWCDVCTTYYPKFDALAKQHPEVLFLCIDVEDQANLVGDFNVENFPTLLVQRNEVVTFY